MNYFKRANELQEESVINYRYIHANAEVGLDLPKTKAYIMDKLREYGIEAKEYGHGVTATIGNGGKVILLRADMDALPMPEQSGLDFVCKTGAHRAYPHISIDLINIGTKIYEGLQELIAREVDPTHACVLTIGKFHAGSVGNIIPDIAELEGTIRTNNKESRETLVHRMKEVAERTAAVYGGSAIVEMISEVPPLICNPQLTDEIVGYM